MCNNLGDYSSPSPDFSEWFHFALKWTPRAIVAGLSGYYCLGVAYDMGIMAAIDRLAIRILRPSLGYMGIAAFMPTFQWYAAWGIRTIVAIGAGLLYDLVERILRTVFNRYFQPKEDVALHPAPLHRPPIPLSPAPLHRAPA